jgi:hypothetical protein
VKQWARELTKEGMHIDREKLQEEPKYPRGSSCRKSSMDSGEDLLVVGTQQEDELRDYERLCASAEALVYAAMIRLMTRRLARV